tara:strand:+ start:264 stop:428 length:165 start_codon:yes stop_codon:yes gene_type:complete
MKEYMFEIIVYKKIIADSLDSALEIVNDKTKHYNEPKQVVLMNKVKENEDVKSS